MLIHLRLAALDVQFASKESLTRASREVEGAKQVLIKHDAASMDRYTFWKVSFVGIFFIQ